MERATIWKDESGRSYFLDNVKGILIICVLVGHFTEPFVSDYNKIRLLFCIIYFFHMAGFFFVSGYLSRNFARGGSIKVERLLYLILLYVAMQLLFGFFEGAVLSKKISFSFFEPRRALWYLMVLAELTATLPFIERLKGKWVMIGSLFLGIGIGLDPVSGHFLSTSRFFMYAPFFYAGYLFRKDLAAEIKKPKSRWLFGCGAVLAICMLAAVYQDIPIGFLSGKNSYESLGYSLAEGILRKSGFYILSGLLIGGLMVCTPGFKTALAHVGKHSMQIYILHVLINLTFLHYDIDGSLQRMIPYYPYLAVPGAVLLAFVLSLPVFSVPFTWLREGSNWICKKIMKEGK